jgi:hypothetical protein
MKCEKCGHEIEEKRIIIGDYEYETETHDFNKCLKDIEIPNGWELWVVSDFEKFSLEDWDNLNLKGAWFHIKYPFAYNPYNFVAWFSAGSDRASLICSRYPTDSIFSLGVRFKRRVKGEKEQ